MSDCIFCGIVQGTIPSTTIDSDERTVAFLDIAPATRGHLLVVPRAHSTDLRETAPEDLTAAILMAQRMAVQVSERLQADGVSIISSLGRAAWQEVFHTHIHVIPRYVGDPLRLPWTPTSGDPDELAKTGGLLRG